MNFETFGDWLAYTRKRRKMTQAKLAAASGLNPTYISKIERNEIEFPRDVTRESLHLALGTSEDDLVALGWLERVPSIDPGGTPYYVEKAHITPGDRAAADAHDRLVLLPRVQEGEAAYDAHEGLRTHLQGYGLTTRQIGAVLAVVDAFRDE